ncbi:MAG: VOC family protein [Pseudomonadales bacterium]|nr:VOC family protein [Pseudomonadales bacterium]MBO6595730.1 VOC family protein [Pseudomonadales bacterium]MBO6820712.1 VOC family protein [Pseudomonadales bacterium]
MDLGAFSVSLSVKDLVASKSFYEALGFEGFGGDSDQGWLMLRNGDHVIGLFQGMFEGNVMTFNPGWDQQAQETAEFTDVRTIQSALESAGLELATRVEEGTSGPGSVMLQDPDGNQILIDQHR